MQKSSIKSILLSFIAFVFYFGSYSPALAKKGVPIKYPYGKVVQFKENSLLHFADFTLTYRGQRSQLVGPTKMKMAYEQFDITTNEEKITRRVEWSSGAGEIAPAIFEIKGKVFWLELKTSDIVQNKFMKDNELIVRPAP